MRRRAWRTIARLLTHLLIELRLNCLSLKPEPNKPHQDTRARNLDRDDHRRGIRSRLDAARPSNAFAPCARATAIDRRTDASASETRPAATSNSP
jgi:hypothetical protein